MVRNSSQHSGPWRLEPETTDLPCKSVMELDVELNVAQTPALAREVRENLSEGFELASFDTPGKFSLRCERVAASILTINAAVRKYLNLMGSLASLLEQASGVLRVGAFFYEGEVAAFGILLSGATVELLAKHRFAIDVTCYPCS